MHVWHTEGLHGRVERVDEGRAVNAALVAMRRVAGGRLVECRRAGVGHRRPARVLPLGVDAVGAAVGLAGGTEEAG